ncbi:MAG TPA: hypothetical protein PLB68_12875 [Candidatus Aminicenantes bacterium]|nr:hypothetical protein [Candidatus Aminicenantes bacterium]
MPLPPEKVVPLKEEAPFSLQDPFEREGEDRFHGCSPILEQEDLPLVEEIEPSISSLRVHQIFSPLRRKWVKPLLFAFHDKILPGEGEKTWGVEVSKDLRRVVDIVEETDGRAVLRSVAVMASDAGAGWPTDAQQIVEAYFGMREVA